MCDLASLQLVEEILSEKVAAGALFTAYDVSREARRRGSPERHRGIRPVVHACYDRGAMAGYTRTLVYVPGAPAPAWLYHRAGDDPHRYPPLRRAAAGGCRADGRSRVCVPVRWLRRAGLRPGDAAFVTADSRARRLFLTKQRPDHAVQVTITTYTVERSGNVRITQSVLRRAGLKGLSFDIDARGDAVAVRVHGKGDAA
jgi:hypothetical protein